MRRLLVIALPVFLLVPAMPALSVQIFRWREPAYQIPLRWEGPLRIRQDPFGFGGFGARRSGARRHRGLDLAAPIGTPVLAAKSGRAQIGRLRNGLGRYVEVRHPDGCRTVYAHLEEIAVRDRQPVRRGDPLGTVGKSGNARRRMIHPHLHFEVWNEAGAPVDPLTVMEVQ